MTKLYPKARRLGGGYWTLERSSRGGNLQAVPRGGGTVRQIDLLAVGCG